MNYLHFLLLISIPLVDGSNIFLYSLQWINSHQLLFYRFAESLQQTTLGHNHANTTANHKVTIWAGRPSSNIRESMKRPDGVHEFRSEWIWVDKSVNGSSLKAIQRAAYHHVSFNEFMTTGHVYQDSLIRICENQFDDLEHFTESAKVNNQAQYDLGILTAFDYCPLMISRMLNISTLVYIQPGSFVVDLTAILFGLERLPSYVPPLFTRTGDRLNFRERMFAGVFGSLHLIRLQFDAALEPLWRGPPHQDRPSLRSLADNVTGIIINGEMMLDFPRPFPITVWYLGKMKSAKEEKLPKYPGKALADQQWLQICDELSSKGTIVFSFGTAVEPKFMPDNWRMGILKALSHFTDYQIIWRFDDPLPKEAKVPRHVKVVSWMPQREILNHPRTKLFITHGGYNSLLESTTAGVPMVMFPLLDLDQHINAQRALRRDIAVVVDKMTLKDSTTLIEAMEQVLSNQSYTTNVRKLRSLYADLPVESYKLNDFKLRMIQKRHFKRIYNQQTVRNLSFIQYYCIDVVVFWVVLIGSRIYILTKLIFKIFRWAKKFWN